jgi:putative membrane protein
VLEARVSAFWGRAPIAWVGFAVLVLAIPLVGLARERGVPFAEALAALNALLNATSATLVFAGWRAIRAGRTTTHWQLMLSATAISVLFLVSYLVRVSLTGVHRYPAEDWTRGLYLAILSTHTVLAAGVPFLVTVTLVLAARKRYERHRRIARVTLPIWLYVSVTGVLVYLLLYHVGPARAAL